MQEVLGLSIFHIQLNLQFLCVACVLDQDPVKFHNKFYVKFLIVFRTEADDLHTAPSNQQLKSPSD
jgi:hypothetical protein